MLIVKIALGLFGLGIVVFVHELGHFLAARLVGIDVEAFSIGWGNPILKKKIGAVEYRLGMFPIGGYCKMRGDNEFKEAWENNAQGIEPVKGTFFGAEPWRRITVSFAGPLFNVVFAALVMSFIWGIGFEVQTLDSRIVLASEFTTDKIYPADEAGFKTGDRIIAVNGKKTAYYHEVQENIAINPDKLLPVTVDRQGETITLYVKPDLDKSTGAGKIGVYFWSDPVVAALVPDGDAAIAGLLPGDRIIRANGEAVTNTIDVMKALEARSGTAEIAYMRNGAENRAEVVLSQPGGDGLGIMWPRVQYRTPSLSPPAALAKGVSESWKTLVISLRSLSLLFKGIELTEAVSGPVRITYMVGDIAAEGFGRSFGAGLRSLADFLALISVALCVMNLLPLPVLDGGMIILFIVEMLRRKPLHPRAINVFQTVGVVLIFSLMIFAVFGDILYLTRR
ncbi:MAG: RIP metalloprotease RseP [Treponema sp.]|jgi:regulator of sigma E protease|nr:RIP metalloprotease RseP [Treponema sp.]